jgi:hypothetical protein
MPATLEKTLDKSSAVVTARGKEIAPDSPSRELFGEPSKACWADARLLLADAEDSELGRAEVRAREVASESQRRLDELRAEVENLPAMRRAAVEAGDADKWRAIDFRGACLPGLIADAARARVMGAVEFLRAISRLAAAEAEKVAAERESLRAQIADVRRQTLRIEAGRYPEDTAEGITALYAEWQRLAAAGRPSLERLNMIRALVGLAEGCCNGLGTTLDSKQIQNCHYVSPEIAAEKFAQGAARVAERAVR